MASSARGCDELLEIASRPVLGSSPNSQNEHARRPRGTRAARGAGGL